MKIIVFLRTNASFTVRKWIFLVFSHFRLFAQTLGVAALDRRGVQRLGYGHCPDLTGLRLTTNNSKSRKKWYGHCPDLTGLRLFHLFAAVRELRMAIARI